MEYIARSAAEEHAHTSTGLNHRKFLMWAFLGSDCMFFGTLIATFMVYRGKSLDGPTEELFSLPITSVSTFVLLTSSLSMVLALAAIQRGDVKQLRIWAGATALLGMVFIGFQMFEFTEFALEGLTPRTNLFGSTFFTLTGFHGAHVTVGVIWLWFIVGSSFFGKIKKENSLDVELAGLYWHFVDIVWIIIFGVIYLIGAFGADEAVHVAAAGTGGG